MKEKTKIIIMLSILIIGILSVGFIYFYNISEQNKEIPTQSQPNYEAMYNMCKSKCSNYTTFDIASKEEVGMKVVLYQNKTIKEVECLCSNNNMSRSVKLW